VDCQLLSPDARRGLCPSVSQAQGLHHPRVLRKTLRLGNPRFAHVLLLGHDHPHQDLRVVVLGFACVGRSDRLGFSGADVGIGIITALYTIAGGLAAVVYTDALQAIILIGGSVLLSWMAMDQVGWWPGLTERLHSLGKTDLLSMVKGPESSLPFSGFLLGNFLVGGMFYWCMDQVNVQRVLGARNVREARLGAVFAGFLKIIPVFILALRAWWRPRCN